MADKIVGDLSVSNDVIADLAGHAAMDCYGVVGMAAPNVQDGIVKLLPAQRLRRGILVSEEDGKIKIDFYVVLEYGTNMAVISQNLIDAVRFHLKETAQIEDVDVNVHVQGMKINDAK